MAVVSSWRVSLFTSLKGLRQSCPLKCGKSELPCIYKPVKKIPRMEYIVNIETCWIAGLWAADKGNFAKGVVAINNKNIDILENFREMSLRNFDIEISKFRQRKIQGYGTSNEVYFTRLPARRFIENLVENRERLSRMEILAFLAGRFDGDGTVSKTGSSLCIYYGNKEKGELKKDERMIKGLGFRTSSYKCGNSAMRLHILRPRFFAHDILPFVKHPEKKERLKRLILKRQYGAERTRPAPYIATRLSEPGHL